MEKRPFYRRFPSDFLAGVVGMSVSEIGAYSVLLDLLYDKWARLDDRTWQQRQQLARRCGCSTRMFGRLVAQLIDREKLFRTPDGLLSNSRFEREFRKINPQTVEDKQPQDSAQDSRATQRSQSLSQKKPKPVAGARDILHSKDLSRVSNAAPRTDENEQLESAEKVELAMQRICKAVGVRLEENTRRQDWPMQVQRMCRDHDLDVDLDLIPAIESYPENIRSKAKSLAYFQVRAIERRSARDLEERLAGTHARKSIGKAIAPIDVDVSTKSQKDWLEHARLWLRVGAWIQGEFGPNPARRSCLMPTELLDLARARWTSQGDHPLEMKEGNAYVPWKPGGKYSPIAEPIVPGSIE